MPVRTLEKREKLRILNDWYRPYREKVFEAVRHGIESRALVVHLAVHTFTPMLDGKARRVEVGLLYDPSRIGEKTYCDKIRRGLREALGTESPPVSVRANRPYLGKSDGFPTTLRGLYPSESYLGIELEVSQGLIAGGGARWQRVRRALLSVFRITSPM
jgi:predicted N-formylglutamate amidohydrolase